MRVYETVQCFIHATRGLSEKECGGMAASDGVLVSMVRGLRNPAHAGTPIELLLGGWVSTRGHTQDFDDQLLLCVAASVRATICLRGSPAFVARAVAEWWVGRIWCVAL